jgi:hypothetical protein
VRYAFTLTTSSSEQPAASRQARRFASVWTVCSVMSSETRFPSTSNGAWPAVKTRSPLTTTGEYGTFGTATLSGCSDSRLGMALLGRWGRDPGT